MIVPLAASGPSPLWYASRGAGATALVLLTLSVVLGIVDQQRWRPARWQRFVVDALHRNVALLVLAVLVVHVGAAVLDSFAPIGLKDVFIPFGSPYRPLWLGFGALAFDLLLLVLLSSVLRRHFGHRAWRSIHWLAYVSWPVAVVHGLGTGTDAKSGWMLALTFTCVAAVLVAVWVRVIGGTAAASGQRTAGLAALVSVPIGLVVWLPNGPLGTGWAKKAGTPASLVSGTRVKAVSARSSDPALSAPFAARLEGSVRRGDSGGMTIVDLPMRFRGQTSGVIDLRLEGQALAGGGLQMTRSQVTLGPASSPAAYRGSVQTLAGQRVIATASDSAGNALRLRMTLALDNASQTVGGTISATTSANRSVQ